MKIFLTGGTGMVGKNILNHPSAKKFVFYAPTQQDLNLLEIKAVKNALVSFKPDIIIHAAGLVGGIKANMSEKYNFMLQNTLMGLNVVSAAVELGISKLINLGSACMYPKDINVPLSEDMLLSAPLEPTNEGYAIAKIAIERLCRYASEEKGLMYKTLIPCNLYGYWDKFDLEKSHIIPAAIVKTKFSLENNNSPIEIWGTGKARREYMFAEDLADFIYFSLENFEKLPVSINIGTGKDFSVLECYSEIKEIFNSKAEFVFNTSKPEGMRCRILDVSKQTALGWAPKTSLKDGIKKTCKFYLENYSK